MSIGFLSSFNSPVLSSEVGDLKFRTSGDYAQISVYHEPDSSVVYSERLYPNADGVCTAYQLGDVLTKWMQDADVLYASFVFMDSVTNTTVNSMVLQCSRIVDGGFLSVRDVPLLSCGFCALPRSKGAVNIYWLADVASRQSLTANVSGIDADGTLLEKSISLPMEYVDGSIVGKSISHDYLISLLTDDDEPDFDEIFVVSLVAGNPQIGSLKASAIFVDDQDFIGFRFRNCFGLLEEIWMHADFMPEISVEFNAALVGHRRLQYDVESSQSFKVEASNIRERQWPMISQFLTSHEIFEVSTGRRVFLSGISQEPPKTYDSLGSVKFSFSYEDDRLIF